MLRFSITTIVLVFLTIVSVLAGVPGQITYQGRIADNTGSPVDTTADLTFSIYADSGGAKMLWTETQSAVEIVDGLFTVILGENNPIPNSVFDGQVRYVGMQIDNGPMPTDLVAIVSSAYAIRAANADTASTLVTDTLNIGSDKVDGVLNVMGNIGGYYPAVIVKEGFGGGGQIRVQHPGAGSGAAITMTVEGDGEGGSLNLYPDRSSGENVTLESSRIGTSEPYFNMGGSTDRFRVDLTKTADSALDLPERSVSGLEMYNEPGCGHARADGYSGILPSGQITTLRSRMMLFPSDGYVVVIASAYLVMYHGNGNNTVNWVGISTSSSSIPTDDQYYTQIPSSAASGYYDYPVTVQAYYEVEAGLNTFYFLGYASSGISHSMYHRKITVMFFPTEYDFSFGK